MMVGDEAEELAWRACVDSGLDDRPHCDPLVFATAYLGLRLVPMRGCIARLEGDRLFYPSDRRPEEIAYVVSHESGHCLVREECQTLDPELEERVASRIGVALLAPRVRLRRDLGGVGWCVPSLREMWPLLSHWIIARRICEVVEGGAVASRWNSRACVDRVVSEGLVGVPDSATAVERGLARAALSGPVRAGDRMRAWPTEAGVIVVCGAEELCSQLARTDPITRRRRSTR